MTIDLTALSDGELATLCLAGRQTAFGQIMHRHQAAIYRLVRGYVGDADESLDLTQETFIAAHSALSRYDVSRPLRTWLSVIALNKCRDWRRKRAVRQFLSFTTPIGREAEAVAEDRGAIEDAVADRQELDRVTRAIAALPRTLKEPLVLRTIEGMTQAETALILEISEKAVETRLYRARQRLAASLS
ncbi:MAG: RNA polymerase sigma factor [Blastomonas fulva]|uniref:RNA polymerase sigma factor n=1 Tax=Blastomonas fulva TaxID=1550728 RepID=UPI0024E1D2D4|nr:RNA polymerase sigma factor [Blastomonas fulva]MDK2759321.1 RNA polymerase sigma factor [Blastomonas fulva]